MGDVANLLVLSPALVAESHIAVHRRRYDEIAANYFHEAAVEASSATTESDPKNWLEMHGFRS